MKSSNSAKVQDLVKDKNWTQTLIHVPSNSAQIRKGLEFMPKTKE